MRTSVEKKVIWSVVLLMILTIIILVAIIFPTAKQILTINKATAELLKNIEIRYENAKNIRANLSKTKNIREEVVGLNKFVFNKENGLSLITMLESMAEQNNVIQKIDNSNFDDQKAKYVNLNLTIQGSYKNIFGYLADLENSNYFININTLNMSPAFNPQKNAAPMVGLKLNISIYAGK